MSVSQKTKGILSNYLYQRTKKKIFHNILVTFEVKLLMGRDEREQFFVHSVLLDHFRVVLSDRFVFIHTFKP